MDDLSSIIERLALSANTFFVGAFCNDTAFSNASGPGHLHLVRQGPLSLHISEQEKIRITEPSLILIAPPVPHRLVATDAESAELVCAEISLEDGTLWPLPLALPNPLVLELASVAGLSATLELLFDEAISERVGGHAAINRLMELLFVLLLRHCIETQELQSGLLAGIAHPKLAKSLRAMHESPGNDWNLDKLAESASMSRARFAASFKEIVGIAPGEYLTTLRIARAQMELKQGQPLKAIAANVGYADATALARAFKKSTGTNPRSWLREQVT